VYSCQRHCISARADRQTDRQTDRQRDRETYWNCETCGNICPNKVASVAMQHKEELNTIKMTTG